MSSDTTFNVVSTGDIVEGFELSSVEQHLVSTLRLKPEQAPHFLSKRRVLKKGVSQAEAERISARLARLGLVTAIEPVASQLEQPLAQPKPAPEQSTPSQGLALELVQDNSDPQRQKAGTIQCPSCNHEQVKGEQCESCGVWFHKLASTSDTGATMRIAQPAISSASMPQSDNDITVDTAGGSEDGAFSAAAFLAAAGAALVGAWAWKFIAVNFGYEFGLVAWILGGAVGFAAASLGAHGIKAGAVCGVLVLAAIVLGKYWTISAFTDPLQQVVSEFSDEGVDFSDFFEEERQDARLLVAGSGSDDFIRQFMVDRQYTDLTNPLQISAQDLSYFREYIEPGLREMAASDPDYEQWKASTVGAITEISPMSLMRESFGILDILFLALGIGTAFRLGSGMGE